MLVSILSELSAHTLVSRFWVYSDNYEIGWESRDANECAGLSGKTFSAGVVGAVVKGNEQRRIYVPSGHRNIESFSERSRGTQALR
jgi:hypothetical protein